MRDLLSLPFPSGLEFSLHGYDLDSDALERARELSSKYGQDDRCEFYREDALELGVVTENSYDVCISNGLNIYIAEQTNSLNCIAHSTTSMGKTDYQHAHTAAGTKGSRDRLRPNAP